MSDAYHGWELGPGTVVEIPPPATRFNAELQVASDAVGSWLLLIGADGEALPLTCYGPDRREQLARVLAVLDRSAS